MDVVTLAIAKNYAKGLVDALPKGVVYKGAVDYYSSLPANASAGDCYTVKYKGTSGTEADGNEYIWGKYEETNQWILVGGASSGLPSVTAADNGKILSVVNGEWAATTIATWNGGSY